VIVTSAQIASAASLSAGDRARDTTISIGLLATPSAAGCDDSRVAQLNRVQATLTRFAVGLATVRVRLHRQWPRRTLFRIHFLSRKPGQSWICSSVLTAIGDTTVDCTGPIRAFTG